MIIQLYKFLIVYFNCGYGRTVKYNAKSYSIFGEVKLLTDFFLKITLVRIRLHVEKVATKEFFYHVY